jgi:hypothetical protein
MKNWHALVMSALCAGCAALTVHAVSNPDFARYHIPKKIAVAGLNDTPETRQRTAEMTTGLMQANFTVINAAYLEGLLAAKEMTLESLINSGDYPALRDVAGIDGIVLVRDFYGTEVHFVETATGRELASGCWRTGYIEVVNDVIDQMRRQKPSPQLCPVKIQR